MGFWSETLLHVVLPRACVHCRKDVPFQSSSPLCTQCRATLAPAPDPACVRCGATLGVHRIFCAGCSGRLFACRLARAAFSYRGPAVSLVFAFKFRGFACAAREAGRAMATNFVRQPELSGFDALVPIPLHPRRERERGYNQALILARELGATTRLPVLELLERKRAAAGSWRLGRLERRAELAGAFTARENLEVKGQRLILIDDVCASGTTFEECAWALRRAGATDVVGYAFARAGRFI